MNHKTLKLITTILDYPDDGSAMLNRFKKLAKEALPNSLKEDGPDFSEQYAEQDKLRKLWDLQRRI